MINKAVFSAFYSYIRKLDLYVLRAFLFALMVSVFSLLGLYIIIHFFTNVSDFIEITQQDIFIFIPRYYFIRLPLILSKLLPIMILIAVMIAISRLMKTRELVAMLSAGIGMHRIMLPIFVVILLIIGGMYCIDEALIPNIAKDLTVTEKILKSEGSDRFLIRHIAGNQIIIKKYDYVKQQMHDIWVNQYDKENNLAAQIVAEKGVWLLKKSVQGWMLSNGTVYYYNEKGLRKSAPQEFAAYEPAKPDPGGFLLAGGLTPQAIESVEESSSYMKSAQLRENILAQPNNKAMQVQYYSRWTNPLVILILIFLGLPFALARKSQSFFTGVGICLVVSLVFFMVKFLSEGLGNKGILNPFLAVILPLIIFGMVGIILSTRIRT